MEFNASKYVLYLEEWHVLVCLHENCKYGLTPTGIKLHFQRHHKDTYSLHIRQALERYAETLQLIEPSKINIPTGLLAPIQGLKVVPGLQCNECKEASTSEVRIKKHCRDKHRWTKAKG